jgi:hypothetical protein
MLPRRHTRHPEQDTDWGSEKEWLAAIRDSPNSRYSGDRDPENPLVESVNRPSRINALATMLRYMMAAMDTATHQP